MTPHKQLFRHDPANGVFGDCGRTVYACLLDMKPEDVPHFFDRAKDDNLDDQIASQKRWLDEQGLIEFQLVYQGNIPLNDILTTVGHFNKNLHYILLGKSPRGVNHVVICLNDQIVHDPSPGDAGIIGPCEDDGYYRVFFLARKL